MIKNWTEKINWLEEDYLSELPTVIAYEYCRMRKLLIEENQIYGALIELKDVLEVTIKFYVATGISLLNSQNKKDDSTVKLLYEITEKELSLGDWAAAASEIAKLDVDESLCNICDEIREFAFSTKGPQLIRWRNQTLGHGALSDASTKEYQDNFLNVL